MLFKDGRVNPVGSQRQFAEANSSRIGQPSTFPPFTGGSRGSPGKDRRGSGPIKTRGVGGESETGVEADVYFVHQRWQWPTCDCPGLGLASHVLSTRGDSTPRETTAGSHHDQAESAGSQEYEGARLRNGPRVDRRCREHVRS